MDLRRVLRVRDDDLERFKVQPCNGMLTAFSSQASWRPHADIGSHAETQSGHPARSHPGSVCTKFRQAVCDSAAEARRGDGQPGCPGDQPAAYRQTAAVRPECQPGSAGEGEKPYSDISSLTKMNHGFTINKYIWLLQLKHGNHKLTTATLTIVWPCYL